MVDTHLLVAAVRKTQGTHKVQKNALSKKHDGAGHRLGEGEGVVHNCLFILSLSTNLTISGSLDALVVD